jgi:hypothetical protein
VNEAEKRQYRASVEEQTQKWLAGEWVHNNVPGLEGGECTPDFGCCKPELRAELSVRKRFVDGDEKTRSSMLSMFLGGLIHDEFEDEMKAHVTDGEPGGTA